jgi:hypothetical protein
MENKLLNKWQQQLGDNRNSETFNEQTPQAVQNVGLICVIYCKVTLHM